MFKKLLFPLIIFIIVLIFNYSNNNSFAYDDKTTHLALTDEVVDFYNLSFSNNQLTSQEKEWIIQGAILEDTPPRWINHFYDPAKKEGWTGEKAGNVSSSAMVSLATAGFLTEDPISAIEWINNSLIQQRYSRYGGDRTWKKSLEYYAYGNKEEAYKTLGHILHLLEDQSVPDHTRNDTHAHELEKITGDYGSPYEEYLKQYNRQTIKKLDISNNLKKENKSPIVKQSIEDYLISLATYSNNYFFSKDTINDAKYNKPKIIRDNENFGYGKDENEKEFILAIARDRWDENKMQYIKEYEILNKEKYYPILDAYFSRLSRQAVLHGAGVINLFRQQAEDAIVNKEYPAHLVKVDTSLFNIPMFSVVGEGFRSGIISFAAQTISSIGGFFSNIFGSDESNKNYTQIIDNTENDILDTNIQEAKSESAIEENKHTFIKIEVQKPIDESQNNDLQNQIALIDDKKDEQIIQNENENLEEENIQQITTTTQQISQPQQEIFKQCSFNINQSPSRQKAIINEIAWMGTTESANNEWIELKNISGDEINLNGWQLIDQGEQIKITFENIDKILANNFYLLERTDDTSVSGVKADKIYTGALSNTNEGLKLFDNQCNLIDEVLANLNWQAGDSAEKRTIERDPGGLNWHTSSVINGTPKKENSSAYVNYGGSSSGGGNIPSNATNIAEQTTRAASSSPVKILINEIQITGGSGKTDHDFIELYNPNNFEVNINGYRLVKRTQTGASDTSIKSWTSDALIPANGYYLWANSNYTDISVSPDITTSATISNDNGIAIRYGAEDTGEIIDSVGWGITQNTFVEGLAFSQNSGVNQSIQRKSFADIGNNADDFELQTCPSPKNQSASCQSSQNNLTDHLVISEIQISGSVADDEFIEIYNPTDQIISLANYSIQYLSGTATSTEKISASGTKKNFAANAQIAPKGFFLLVNSNATTSLKDKIDMAYSSFSLSGSQTGASIFLVSTSTPISDIGDLNIIDSVSYGNVLLAGVSTSIILDVNKSFERKSFIDNQCAIAGDSNEFLGNGCDTGSNSDFEIRNVPNSQNSQSLPEPRVSPTTSQNFSVIYSTSTPVPNQNISALSLILSWNASQDYSGVFDSSTIIYKIIDISNSSSTLSAIETTSTTANFFIDEIGRDYNFSIQALDKDGLGSATSTVSISIPSFLTSLYFYKDPRTTDAKYLIDINWQNYPFAPKKIEFDSSWRLVVFYLNKDAEKVSSFGDWDWGISANSVVKLKYPNCASVNSVGPVLILPDDQSRCSNSYGGSRNSSLLWNQLEDPHLTIELDGSNPIPSAGDYFTLAFYAYDGWNNQALIAVDKTKYYFQNEAPANQSPNALQNISFVSYDEVSKDLMFSLSPAIDVDSVDQNLSYLASFSTSTNFSIWESLGWYNNPYQTKVQANVGDKIAVKAVDDFNNSSLIKIITLTGNNGEYGISIEDAQLPINNFQEIVLAEQNNDGLLFTKSFNYGAPLYGFTQEFSPQTSGYLSKVKVKASKLNSDSYFTLKIKENDAVVAESDGMATLFSSEAENKVLTFRKTPFLEAGKIYKLIFEAGNNAVVLYGDGADIYYKIYGLTQ